MRELTTQRDRLRDERGFTLLELMIVVSIIAVLIAIAIPTFLGVQERARNRVAQSDLRTAVVAVRTIAAEDDGLFPSITGPNLMAVERALSYVPGAGTEAAVGWTVVTAADPQRIQLSRLSTSGVAFGIRLESDGSVYFCQGDIADVDDTTDVCIDRTW